MNHVGHVSTGSPLCIWLVFVSFWSRTLLSFRFFIFRKVSIECVGDRIHSCDKARALPFNEKKRLVVVDVVLFDWLSWLSVLTSPVIEAAGVVVTYLA